MFWLRNKTFFGTHSTKGLKFSLTYIRKQHKTHSTQATTMNQQQQNLPALERNAAKATGGLYSNFEGTAVVIFPVFIVQLYRKYQLFMLAPTLLPSDVIFCSNCLLSTEFRTSLCDKVRKKTSQNPPPRRNFLHPRA